MSQFPESIPFSLQMRSQIFKKEGASNDEPLRHLKHFFCQDDAEILELGSVFTIKCIYDSIKLLKRRKMDYRDLRKHAK